MSAAALLIVLLASHAAPRADGAVSGAALTRFRCNGRRLDVDLLPRGTVSVGAAQWHIDPSGSVVLAGNAVDAVALRPPAPAGATHLVFLHTFQPAEAIRDHRAAVALAHRQLTLPPEGPTVFRYEVEYADGEVLAVPVRWGEGIEHWYRLHAVAPMLWARDAWTAPIDPGSGENVAVYAMVWPNPRPDKTVAAVRAVPIGDPHSDYGDALILGVAAVREPPQGRSFYVDPTPIGSDDGPGTFDEPWATVQHAVDSMRAGDTVYLRGGHYALSRAVVVQDYPGEPGKWFTISAYPGETPVLDGFGVLYDPRLKPYNDEARNWAPFQHDRGIIDVRHVPGWVRVQGLRVQRSRRAGISVHGNLGAPRGSERPRFVELAFNTMYLTETMGTITHQVDDLRIVGNRVVRPHSERMYFTVPENEPASKNEHAQEAIDLSRVRRFELAFNEVCGGGKEAIDIISCQDGRVHHNYVDSCLNGIYIDSWTIPIERLEIDHNYIVNAFNGIPCSTEGSNDLIDFRIHHNIVVDAKTDGINIGEATYKARPAAVHGHRIYNNTVHRAGYHATSIGWYSAGIYLSGFPENEDYGDIDVFNNIVTDPSQRGISCSFPDMDARDLVFTHNLLHPEFGSAPRELLAQRPAVKGESTVVADPLYVDAGRGDFRLRDGSPAIGTGVGVTPDGQIDRSARPADPGALPHGAAWLPGLDWAGRVTSHYRGETDWRPVSVPRHRFTMHRNHLQRPSWVQQGRYGSDYQRLPSGEQSLGGITWFIEEDLHNSLPTVLALRGLGSESVAADITGVPVGRRADALAFLHTALVRRRSGLQAGDEIFRYILHYADGTAAEIPIHVDQAIAAWQGDRRDLPEATIAWTCPTIKRWGRMWLRLFAFVWENPRPDAEIATIDIVRTAPEDRATPAVFAISTGHR